MKTISFSIDEFSVGRKGLVDDLGFVEKEYYYFTKEDSFYRKYNLELGLDVFILDLSLGEEIILKQNISANPIYYFRILEFVSEGNSSMKCSTGNSETAQDLMIKKSENFRGLWFSFSQRWLENKIPEGDSNSKSFTKLEDSKTCPNDPYFDSLYAEIFDLAHSSALNNFRIKIKLYACLELFIR